VRVTDLSTGRAVPSAVMPALPSVSNYGEALPGAAHAVVFDAALPPGGFATFGIHLADAPVAEKVAASAPVLENRFLRAEFDDRGLLRHVLDKASGVAVDVRQTFGWYAPSSDYGQQDGAYIFRPSGQDPQMFAQAGVEVSSSEAASCVLQTFAPWLQQRVRLSSESPHLELTFTVGPLPDDGWGTEVISRFETSIDSEGVSYTDSNGRDMIRRENLSQTEPVAGNYFPVTTAMYIRDGLRQASVLTDATQGGTGSLRSGHMELMVHRRLFTDDGRGVAEALDETESISEWGQRTGRGLVVRGTHRLIVGPAGDTRWRASADCLYAKPLLFFPESVERPAQRLLSELPAQAEILGLEPHGDGKVLLRLGHQYAKDEGAMAAEATVDLDDLFVGHDVSDVEEVNVVGMPLRKERHTWKGVHRSYTTGPSEKATLVGRKVILRPLDIRAFRLRLHPKVLTGALETASKMPY